MCTWGRAFSSLDAPQVIAIPYAKGKYCPVKALKAWLAEVGITEGAIFRPILKYGGVGKKRTEWFSVAQIITASARAAGLDTTLYSGHSLRAGLATSSAREKKPFHKIKAQTRHKSDVTLHKYIRDAELFARSSIMSTGYRCVVFLLLLGLSLF